MINRIWNEFSFHAILYKTQISGILKHTTCFVKHHRKGKFIWDPKNYDLKRHGPKKLLNKYSQWDSLAKNYNEILVKDDSRTLSHEVDIFSSIEKLTTWIFVLQGSDPSRPPVTLCIWDLAGDDANAATHHCFFTRDSLYLLVWDIWSLQSEMEKLGKLLYSIEVGHASLLLHAWLALPACLGYMVTTEWDGKTGQTSVQYRGRSRITASSRVTRSTCLSGIYGHYRVRWKNWANFCTV